MPNISAIERKHIAFNYLYKIGIITRDQLKDCIDLIDGNKTILKITPDFSISEDECIKQIIIRCK